VTDPVGTHWAAVLPSDIVRHRSRLSLPEANHTQRP